MSAVTEARKSRLILGVLGGLLATGVAGQSSGAPYVGAVNGSEVRIRTGGSQNHFPFATLKMGQMVVVEGEQNGWCRIHIPRWIPVYVHKDYVNVSGARGVVKAGELNIRVVPQKAHEVVGGLPVNSDVEILGKEGDWYKIVAPLSAFAFINQKYIVKDREVAPADVSRQVAMLTEVPALRLASGQTGLASGQTGLASGQKGQRPAERSAGLLETTATPRFSTAPLRKADDLLRALSARDLSQRDYAPVKEIYQEVVSSSEDKTEISAAEEALKKIEKLESNRDILRSAQERIAETEQKNQELDMRVREARISGRGSRALDSDTYLARGWVTGLGRFNGQPGTHRLMKGSQVLYFLQSEEGKPIQLDAYLNRRVGVKGVIRELDPKFGANLIVVNEISVFTDN